MNLLTLLLPPLQISPLGADQIDAFLTADCLNVDISALLINAINKLSGKCDLCIGILEAASWKHLQENLERTNSALAIKGQQFYEIYNIYHLNSSLKIDK